MAAYSVFDNIQVHDEQKLAEYREAVRSTVEQHGGRYVVVGGTIDLVEGSYRPVFPVIIEFPSLEHARRWYNSDEYRELKALRLSATTSNAYFVEGVAEES